VLTSLKVPVRVLHLESATAAVGSTLDTTASAAGRFPRTSSTVCGHRGIGGPRRCWSRQWRPTRCPGAGPVLALSNQIFLLAWHPLHPRSPDLLDDHPRASLRHVAGVDPASIAFSIPISVLILTNFLRRRASELFRVDAPGRLHGLGHAVAAGVAADPDRRVTAGVYNALNVWNAFLFPLILTQSPELRVLPLSLWTFQGEFQLNIPAVLASVVLASLPLLVIYVVARRQLVSGMTAGFTR